MEHQKEFTITCANGIRPRLLALNQYSPYAGLLDGGPTHELNEEILASIEDQQGQVPTFLVRPEERPHSSGLIGPGGRYMELPRLQCSGLFESGINRLNIVWFQEEWALPIDDDALSQFADLNFLANSVDMMEVW